MPLIRAYEAADHESWLRCRVLSFLSSSYYDDVRTARVDLPPGSVGLVAVEGPDVVGLLDIEVEGQAATIDTVAVHPDHTRRGIAQALLTTALRALDERGVTTLDAWTREDPAANGWYQAQGFSAREEYLHAYVPPYADTRGLTAQVGTVVGAFLHAPLTEEPQVRERYSRVHVCRRYLRTVRPA